MFRHTYTVYHTESISVPRVRLQLQKYNNKIACQVTRHETFGKCSTPQIKLIRGQKRHIKDLDILCKQTFPWYKFDRNFASHDTSNLFHRMLSLLRIHLLHFRLPIRDEICRDYDHFSPHNEMTKRYFDSKLLLDLTSNDSFSSQNGQIFNMWIFSRSLAWNVIVGTKLKKESR